jgi:Ser/Thr protein kinase RdoA (MazF antagonist)
MPLAAWTTLLGSGCSKQESTSRIWNVTCADGREYVLKQPTLWAPEERRQQLVREFRVLSHLHGHGVPVAMPVVTDDGAICAEQAGDLYVLLPRIPYDTGVPEEHPDAVGVYRRVGAAIARLSVALADCPFPVPSDEIDIAELITPERWDRLSAADPELGAKLARIAPAMRAATAGLPRQLTHGDCHDGNLLLRDGRVAGFIDVDYLVTAPRIGDVNRWLGNRILWALEAPDERWPAFLRLVDSFLAGYSEVSPLTEQELSALGPALLVNELDTAQWCLDEGDTSSSYATGLFHACHWLADRGAALR